MSAKIEYCNCCGARLTKHKHTLSALLIAGLYALYEKGNPSYVRELGLDHSQSCNFQKLKYWQLITKGDKDDKSESRWQITKLGADFLFDGKRIPKSVMTFRDQPFSTEDMPTVSVIDVMDGEDMREWKRRASYEADSIGLYGQNNPQGNLFDNPKL